MIVRVIVTRGASELAIDVVTPLAGFSRRMAQQALRLAHYTGSISVRESRRHGDRNRTNRIIILLRELSAGAHR